MLNAKLPFFGQPEPGGKHADGNYRRLEAEAINTSEYNEGAQEVQPKPI